MTIKDQLGSDAPNDKASTEQFSPSPDYLASLRLVSGFITGSRLKLIAAVFLATASVALELVPIWVVYHLIVQYIEQSVELSQIWYYAGISLAAIVSGFALLGLSLGLSHIVAFDAIYGLRKAIARHMSTLPLGYFSNKKSSDAKKLIIDEPEKLELIIAHGLPEGVSALAMWIAVSVWLFIVDWRMAIVSILVTPVSFVLLVMAMTKGGKYAYDYQSTNQVMNASIMDFLSGIAVVKIFNRTGESFRQTKEAIQAYTNVEKQWGKAYIPLGGSFFSLVLTNIVFILPAGLFFMAAGEIELSTLVFFVILGANYSQPLLKLFNQFHQLAHISMGSMLVDDLLSVRPQEDNKAVLPLTKADVCFQNVSFSYGENEVIHDVCFTAKENSITALVGPSGSGKSTLASLIPRFWDIQSGSITIGGYDVREMGLSQLMDTVAFVFQDTFLFTDTIAENIRFGVPYASDEEVIAAAKAAQAHNFISELPQGYATKIGYDGTKLSGGERQRIAIARAILKNSPIIILDEATAFADPDNEALVQQAISRLAKGKTVIVIAHRLHTIANADQILVVDKGSLVESGQHDALLANESLYASLWHDYNQARNQKLKQSDHSETGVTA
ncbi:ABC transporter ATP-binding protein/permease [Vibrio sp. JC009]|uniref:ABC transporter ATP-binding protein n=1 Tax=Vibrio sp. JC009 TaxID=2912314 RepID=UPI0023B0C579|nr:ABC transporter ATP-binding protein [Vibrio sp. JC009]WED24691.1 ABC transporter ATP-binding protein/permease [Vibrio sp. JC009]